MRALTFAALSARPLAALALAACQASVTLSPRGTGWVNGELSRMTLREKAAQMVWPSLWADYQAEDSREWARRRDWVQQEKVGGMTIGLGSPVDFAALTNRLQSMSDVPLLFAADFEFGAGYRARGGHFMPNAIDLGGATIFPPQMALGATGDTALAYAQGRITALEGRAIGVHINYAPILDVNVNPANPVINTRSYGEDPALVARMGAAFIHGTQDHGMVATGKHFPGHGDTEVNSHLGLPVINMPRTRLDSVELVPFDAAIRAGVQAIMSFHGAMLALDSSGAPGTLSSKVLTQLLRNDLRFQGLAISDAMDMRGVLDTYGPEEAAIRAVEAGADILIQPVDVKQTIDAVVRGVQQGRYDEARLERSVRAILELKQRLGLPQRRTVDVDSVRARVGVAAHRDAARVAAERSITLVRDSLELVPLRAPPTGRVLAVTLALRNDIGAGLAFNAELRTFHPRVRAERVDADGADRDAALARVIAAADSAEIVIVSSYVSHAWNASSIAAPRVLPDFLSALTAKGKRPILISFGNPYLLQQVPAVPAYMLAWGGFPVSQSAAARALAGATPIGGVLPVNIPPVRIGTGLRR